MKKLFKIVVWTLAAFVLVLVAGGSLFFYKITHGFPVSYETAAPVIHFPSEKNAILLFSKATGFRHGESIEAGKTSFEAMAERNGWFLYSTEEGGVFNADQLERFDAVIFNNCTGRILNEDQQQALQNYVEHGGSLIGIHGSGDNSHHWEWYEQNFIGADFSHHPIDPQLQQATVAINSDADSLLSQNLPASWAHTDEWYIFFENPATKGFKILCKIDGETIKPSGNLLWISDKNFGMGPQHPVAWYRGLGRGRTFYTSMGHNREAWEQPPFVKMLENAVKWSLKQ